MSEQKVELDGLQWITSLVMLVLIVFCLVDIKQGVSRITTALEAPKAVQPGIDVNDTDALLKGLGLLEEADEWGGQ